MHVTNLFVRECRLALALEEELHRLVDEIPDTRPEVARVLFEFALLLVFASGNDELLYRRFLREVAEAQATSKDPDALMAALKALRDRWVHGPSEAADPVLERLESAPDDEPLTPDEVAMRDARRAAVATEPTIPHHELGRKLRA